MKMEIRIEAEVSARNVQRLSETLLELAALEADNEPDAAVAPVPDIFENSVGGGTMTENKEGGVAAGLPLRVCRDCRHYIPGGECPKAHLGVTSALQPADDKKCFEAKPNPMAEELFYRRECRGCHTLGGNDVPSEEMTKVCSRCGRRLPLADFGVRKGKPTKICKECLSVSLKEGARRRWSKKKSDDNE